GKYSLYGLIPRLHVAKVDASTLPAGTRLEVLGNRNALDATSAFVDLTNGELHKTDFGLAGCPAGLREQIEARRQALKTPSEILQLSRTLFSENNTHLTATDARTAPASGTIQLPGATPGPAGNTSPVAPLAMASGMAGITPFAGSPAPLGAVADPGGPYAPQAQGVPLPLNVPARAPLQEDSTALPTTVAAPQAVADAATVVTVTIRLRDANDLPVSARTPVTLSTTLGRWQRAAEAGSVDSGPSGNQVFVTGGALRLLLLPPAQPGKAEL